MDEICEKYELSKLQDWAAVEDYVTLCRQTNIGDICAGVDENVTWDFGSAYMYDDGTFSMDGRVSWNGSSIPCVTDYQFERTMKGSFNPVTLNVGEIGEYREWDYVTGSGQVLMW